MNLTLPLTPAEEARLMARARAEGTTPERLVRQAINPIVTAEPDQSRFSAGSYRAVTGLEADTAFDELIDTLPPMPSLSDKALSRDSIYAPDKDSR